MCWRSQPLSFGVFQNHSSKAQRVRSIASFALFMALLSMECEIINEAEYYAKGINVIDL